MIKVFTLENSIEWDKIVKSFLKYDVYYLSGYVRAFELNGDGKANLIYFECDNTKAISVMMKRDLADYKYFQGEIKKNCYYDFISPYGYGGFIVEGDNLLQLKEEYTTFCMDNNIICEFVRFHPITKTFEGMENLYETLHLGNTVFMDTKDDETIWLNLTSKNRNMIRKAQKSGVTVVQRHDREIIPIFMELYNATMSKDNAEDYYFFKEDFYDSIYKDLADNSFWLCAEYEGQIIASAIFMYGNGQMHYHLSASNREYQSLAPTNLILFEAATWAAHHGCTTLHLGGGVGSGEDNLYRFKKAFNRYEDSEFYIGKAIYNLELYNKFVELRKSKDSSFDENTGWFPKYRG